MNITNRIFAVLDDDSVVKIPNYKIEKLLKFREDTKFPEFRNKKIRIVSFLLEIKERKPIRVVRDNYYFYEFNGSGMLDKNKHFEQLRVQLYETVIDPNLKVSEGGVKYANKETFNKSSSIQYQWIPTTAVTSELQKQLFGK